MMFVYSKALVSRNVSKPLHLKPFRANALGSGFRPSGAVQLGAVAIVLLVMTCMLAAELPGEQAMASPPANLTPLMRMKLERSKAILEGLALEEFDKIANNARALRLLSTESGWNVIQTKEYALQSRDFQRAADLIAEAAGDQDIHRAAIGYVALTVRCVECHSYMRKHQVELMKLEVK